MNKLHGESLEGELILKGEEYGFRKGICEGIFHIRFGGNAVAVVGDPMVTAIRMLVTATNGEVYTTIADLAFRTANDTGDLLTGGTASASSAQAGTTVGPITNLFDGSDTTSWRCSGGGIPAWAKYTFATSIALSSIKRSEERRVGKECRL